MYIVFCALELQQSILHISYEADVENVDVRTTSFARNMDYTIPTIW